MQNNKVAIYCRLSKEDGSEESQSIASQREVLINYVNQQGWKIYDIYIDDGYSGTNFQRPGFQRLLNDIENKIIDIVITKDLSRLGRNYIQTGYYTEDYFPSHNIRYIALNDGYDTLDDELNDFAPFKNIINEWYAKDISKKIRFTLDNNSKNGMPKNTVFPLFGYSYNSEYERIIDPETSLIVKQIFNYYIKTSSISKVVSYLRENKIKRPCYYNAIKYNYNKDKVLMHDPSYFYNWNNNSVRQILMNYEYTGAYITAKSKSINYKTKKRDRDNKDKYIFENRYEGIIEKELFEKVQNMLSSNKSGTIPVEKNIFKGIVKCYDCGETLRFERRSPNKKNKNEVFRYYCNNKNCENTNTIKLDVLSKIILKEICNIKNILLTDQDTIRCEEREVLNKIKKNPSMDAEIEKYHKRKEQIDNYIKILIEDNATGKIPSSTYENLLGKYANEKKAIDLDMEYLYSNNIYKNDLQKINIIDELNKLDEHTILKYDFIKSVIKKISIKAIKKENKYNKLDYIVNIRYYKIN